MTTPTMHAAAGTNFNKAISPDVRGLFGSKKTASLLFVSLASLRRNGICRRLAVEPVELLGQITLNPGGVLQGGPGSCRSLRYIRGSPQLGIAHQTCRTPVTLWAGPLTGSASGLGPGRT